MNPAKRYALTFPGTPGTQAPQDVVVVTRTSASGPGGHPVYEDESGIVSYTHRPRPPAALTPETRRIPGTAGRRGPASGTITA